MSDLDPYDLPCQQLVELVTDYLDGALDPDVQARFEAHLTVCPPCVDVLEQFRTITELAGRLTESDVEHLDPEVLHELQVAFRDIIG